MPLPSEPYDAFARQLSGFTRPESWRSPVPASRYNLVVVGAGPAGLVCAAGAAGLGAKVALIEKYRLGGDCLHFGCVPSKALIRCARTVAEIRRAADFGVLSESPRVDFTSVMERMRRLRAEIGHADSAERFAQLGVDVFFGTAQFAGPDSVTVGESTLRFARAAVTTGATAADPGLSGLGKGDYLTNETIFNLRERPRRLLILGAGPIGCELAQAFARFGCEVHLVNRSPQILAREEPDASAVVDAALRRDGVQLHLGVRLIAGGSNRLRFEEAGREQDLEGDALLVAVGRRANVAELNLPMAGVAFDDRGVVVDDLLRTTNRRVFAAGDVCSRFPYTHAADAMARIVLRNALFFGRARWSRQVIPHCTYTDPEVASVGLTADEARKRGLRIATIRVPLADVDRAILDGETEGFAQVHVKSGTDRIVGATIVASHAGEMINELTLAMGNEMGLRKLAAVVRPYPTQAEVVKKIADAYQRARLTPRATGVLRWILRWRR